MCNGAERCKAVQNGTERCRTVQNGAEWCGTVQNGAERYGNRVLNAILDVRMCKSNAGPVVEGIIYLNCQTEPSDHRLSEAEAKGPGPGRDGVRGAEQPATTSAEAKVHPSSPLEGGGAKSEL